jgi:DNA-binding NarL/FixJ family response regulator
LNTNVDICVMIVDDHAVVRRGLALVLRLADGIEVVGEVGNPNDAAAMAKELRPDIILLDRIMPDSEPQSNVRMLREAAPDSHIIMLTGTELDDQVISILKSGVDGYVLKEIEPAELTHAIRTVASGDAYLQPSVTRHVIDRLILMDEPKPASILTPREQEILVMMNTTATYREIGRQLSISEETVRSHSKHILSKLGQPNRASAIKEAERLGLL